MSGSCRRTVRIGARLRSFGNSRAAVGSRAGIGEGLRAAGPDRQPEDSAVAAGFLAHSPAPLGRRFARWSSREWTHAALRVVTGEATPLLRRRDPRQAGIGVHGVRHQRAHGSAEREKCHGQRKSSHSRMRERSIDTLRETAHCLRPAAILPGDPCSCRRSMPSLPSPLGRLRVFCSLSALHCSSRGVAPGTPGRKGRPETPGLRTRTSSADSRLRE
jgi:hypothetical protein